MRSQPAIAERRRLESPRKSAKAPAIASRTASRAPALIVFLAIIGYQLSSPANGLVMGEKVSTGLSLELVLSLPLVFFSLHGFLLLARSRIGTLPLFSYTGFAAWVLLGALFEPPAGGPRELVPPLAQLMTMCSAAYLFYHHHATILRHLPAITLTVIGIFTAWLLWSYAQGEYTQYAFDGSSSLTRYSVAGMAPTELAALLGSQFCYLLASLRLRPESRLLVYSALLLNVALLLFVAGSKAAMGGYGLVLAFLALRSSVSQRLRLFGVLGIAAVLLLQFLVPYLSTIQESTESLLGMEDRENVRVPLYLQLIETAQENWAFGIGMGNFVEQADVRVQFFGIERCVPHQNILGRACENGIPAAACYIVFIVATIWTLWGRPASSAASTDLVKAGWFMDICLCGFLYFQFRGLFTDTWMMKEMFFFAGAGLGLRVLETTTTPTRGFRR